MTAPAQQKSQLSKRELASLEHKIVEKARVDINVFAPYVFGTHNQQFHRFMNEVVDGDNRFVTFDAPIEFGKALPVTTPIPTPKGWVKIGALRKGDAVFDARGEACRVTFITPIQNKRTVYRITFDDGSTSDADADHLWIVIPPANLWARLSKKDTVVTTAQMLAEGITFDAPAKRQNGDRYHEYRWRIPLAEPVDYPAKLLPIHPYVLGAWLGDGTSNTPQITFHSKDREIYDRCRKLEGGTLPEQFDKRRPDVIRGNIGSIATYPKLYKDPLRFGYKLKLLGILENKHIPEDYLTAGIEQREELLAGLLDTDGSIYGRNPRIELSFCNERLAADALELIRSLGFKASMISSSAKIYNRVVGQRFRIGFTAYRPVFHLPRKREKQKLGEPHGRTSYRCITNIQEIESIPVVCIAVDSRDESYLAGKNYVVTHNTTQFSVIRPTFQLGRNPYELMALVSSSPDLPQRALKVIRGHIKENERLHRVFPKLKLAENTRNSITVERPRSAVKDASAVAMGIEGAILGRRWTWLITDDILRFSTTWTEDSREKIWQRLSRELLGRLTAKARHTDIGTPWVASDARHRLRRRPGYLFLRFDGWTGECYDIAGKLVRRFDGGLWPTLVKDPITGIEWGWPRWRLENLRKAMPGHEFDRQIRGLALSAAMEIFGTQIDICKKLGQGIRMEEEVTGDGKIRVAWRRPERHWRTIFTGVDLAIDKKATSDDTAFFTGACEDRQKHILELRRGKMEGPDILRNMIAIVKRYPMHTAFRVETNSAFRFVKQFSDEPGMLEALGATPEEADRIRIYPHMTGSNIAAEGIGVRSMNVDFERHRWPIPCEDDMGSCALVQEWIDGLRSFDPINHADDMVIASWLFWEQTREMGYNGGDEWNRFGIFVP